MEIKKNMLIKGLFLAMTLMIVPLLLTSCSHKIDHPLLKEFLMTYPEATYSDVMVDKAHFSAMGGAYLKECPQIKAPFRIRTYKEYGAWLKLYIKGNEVVCAVPGMVSGNVVQGVNGTEGVALVVNGNPISIDELRAALATIPKDKQSLAAINSVIDDLVSQKLLLQEASRYNVSDEEVESEYVRMLSQANLSEEDFEAGLVNITLEDVKEQIRNSLKLKKLLNQKLNLDEIDVSDEDARDYYLNNTNQFVMPDRVTFQQIYIRNDSGRVRDALNAIDVDGFCSAVYGFSDDLSSKSRCGTYTVPRGLLTATLDSAIFSAPLNKSFVVESNGQHIIRVLKREPATVATYAEAKPFIIQAIKNRIAGNRIRAYIAFLKENSNITSYLSVS